MKTNQILITGAGGAAAINVYKSIANKENEIHMADASIHASGLYVVEKDHRHILPLGRSEDFITSLLYVCMKNNIDILIPTVDAELLPIAESAKLFEAIGTKIIIPSLESLQNTLDKFTLLSIASKQLEVGPFALLSQAQEADFRNMPVVVKPRKGSGSEGVEFYKSFQDIPQEKFAQEDLLIQQKFTGMEYSVDMVLDYNHQVLAAAPRTRLKTDSGISVTGKIDDNKEVREYAIKAAQLLHLTYAANVQVMLTEQGPRLIEINPRFSGGLCLSIRAGANTPDIALKIALGKQIEKVTKLEQIAMVRYYEEIYTKEI